MKIMWKVLAISMVIAGILITILAGAIYAANGNGNRSGCAVNSTVGVVSELLGLSPEEIQEQRQAGQSLVQIAEAQGVTEDELIEAIMADKQTRIEDLLNSGTITQDQADLRLEQMRERVQLAVNRTEIGPPEWSGANGQNGICNGMIRHSGLHGNQENCTGTPGTCTGDGNMQRAGKNSD